MLNFILVVLFNLRQRFFLVLIALIFIHFCRSFEFGFRIKFFRKLIFAFFILHDFFIITHLVINHLALFIIIVLVGYILALIELAVVTLFLQVILFFIHLLRLQRPFFLIFSILLVELLILLL